MLQAPYNNTDCAKRDPLYMDVYAFYLWIKSFLVWLIFPLGKCQSPSWLPLGHSFSCQGLDIRWDIFLLWGWAKLLPISTHTHTHICVRIFTNCQLTHTHTYCLLSHHMHLITHTQIYVLTNNRIKFNVPFIVFYFFFGKDCVIL